MPRKKTVKRTLAEGQWQYYDDKSRELTTPSQSFIDNVLTPKQQRLAARAQAKAAAYNKAKAKLGLDDAEMKALGLRSN